MRTLLLVAVVAACGGGSDRHGPSDGALDARGDGHVVDAPVDTRPIDARPDAPVDARPDAPPDAFIVIVDAPDAGAPAGCDPLTQTGCNAGEKCTWLVDQFSPSYAGRIACVPDGVKAIGATCMYGAAGSTGYDDCAAGGVCSAFSASGTPGTCKAICDNQGGTPMCDSTHACVTYSRLFSTGPSSPAAAGVCDPQCDPLADNDFDGSGSALSRTGTICGSATNGCYGLPSGGTPPATTFTCSADIHYGTPLVHRTECTGATGCTDVDGTIYLNSCNQGYEPLFYESTAVSVAVCVAMCKPANCYAGHCGTNDADHVGAAPHRCANPDALGAFGPGEDCEYLWAEEIDLSQNYLPSAWSNAVGLCFDHTKYKYDPNMGTNYTTPYPTCSQLQLHATGTDPNQPLTYFGATDFGCVDSATAGFFTGKPPAPKMRDLRVPYHRTMR